jgi:hypothetical protein
MHVEQVLEPIYKLDEEHVIKTEHDKKQAIKKEFHLGLIRDFIKKELKYRTPRMRHNKVKPVKLEFLKVNSDEDEVKQILSENAAELTSLGIFRVGQETNYTGYYLTDFGKRFVTQLIKD